MLTVTDFTRNWTPDIKLNVFDDIKGILLASQESYDKIAERAYVHPTTLQKWVSGDVKSPHLLKVLAVANALGYDLVLMKRRRKLLN